MTDILQIIGFIGAVLIAVAYLPQIIHLIKKRCAMGIDKGAWELWIIATALILVHAVSTKEPVFVTLITINLFSTIIIFTLKMKYKDNVCRDHILKHKTSRKIK